MAFGKINLTENGEYDLAEEGFVMPWAWKEKSWIEELAENPPDIVNLSWEYEHESVVAPTQSIGTQLVTLEYAY